MALARLLRSIREALPLLLMWACLLEGLIAMAAMFIFPPLALGMVFVGLLTLAMTPLARRSLYLAERSVYWLLAHDPADEAADTTPP
ncbi:MAG: hypothetical protein MK101_08150 [Phycisphaerales bacterium]|nr:hypothetical protein [Phycisphaerales bacterium]